MITLNEYISIVKKAEQIGQEVLRATIQPDNQSDGGPIEAETSADDDVRRAQTKIPKAASARAPEQKTASRVDGQLAAIQNLMVKNAIQKTALGLTPRGVAATLSPGHGMKNTGKNLGKTLTKGTIPSLNPTKNTVPALNPNQGMNSTAGVTLNVGGGAKLKPGVANPTSFKAPSNAGIAPKGSNA